MSVSSTFDLDEHLLMDPPLLSKQALEEGAWLTDIEISCFLEKLKQHSTSNGIFVNGLHNPIELMSKKVIPSRSESFVEILNSNQNHWVCVAAGICIEDEDVCLFDSMSRKSIDSQLGKTVADLVVTDRLK